MSGRFFGSRRLWVSTAASLIVVFLSTYLASCQRLMPLRQGWDKAAGPVVPHDKFPADCSLCHTGAKWTTIRKDFTFDHEAKTGVPLRGAHRTASCLMCHNDRGPVVLFSSRGCAGCHEDPHRAKLGQSCEKCHDERTWTPTGAIATHNRTHFPLLGAHAATACFSCHPGAQIANFSGLDTACATCHRTDLARTNAPNHFEQGWTSNCQTCHTPRGWQSPSFRHTSLFPLTGGHAGLSCTQCHKGTVFVPLATQCVNCHLADYQKTRDPNHVQLGFSTDCAECHTPRGWRSGNAASLLRRPTAPKESPRKSRSPG